MWIGVDIKVGFRVGREIQRAASGFKQHGYVIHNLWFAVLLVLVERFSCAFSLRLMYTHPMHTGTPCPMPDPVKVLHKCSVMGC